MQLKSSVIIYADGSSRGNPGPAGIGLAIFAADNLEKPVKEISKYIGITTNNVAEYEAVIHALKWMVMENIEHATIKIDSELVYNQISGKYRVKSGRMAPMIRRIRDLKMQTKSLLILLIPREENKSANRLAQRASKQVKVKHQSFQQKQLID